VGVALGGLVDELAVDLEGNRRAGCGDFVVVPFARGFLDGVGPFEMGQLAEMIMV
jgi:hypothetical protein